MSRHITLIVAEDEPSSRLDHFLGVNAPELSRTRAKELILEGTATLNGQPAKPSSPVSPGDVIEADIPEQQAPDAAPEDIPLEVVFEDDDIVVIDKPAGMVVHPAPGSASGTLVNALLGRGGELSGVGGVLRPGIVHRLDRDTSGLIVVAKNDVAHRAMSDAFQERRVKKTYFAIVWGTFTEEEGEVSEPIARRTTDRKKMGVSRDGREAVTPWRVREEFPYATLLELRPKTGRTHQIRVHLSHLRRAVMGDTTYGGDKANFGDVPPHYRRQAKRANDIATRHALHARELRFPHPSGKGEVHLTAPIPEDMARILSALRYPEGEKGRIIGIDPGEVRVGVAVSDESRMLARPLETLKGLDDAGVAAAVARLCDVHEALVVVVGHPIRMDGTTGPRAVRSRELAVAIEDATHARVVLRDERLSSVEAERIMRERGEKARGRKGRVDELAASVILQGHLDSLSSGATT